MFFIACIENRNALGSKEKCTICSEKLDLQYNPMEEWKVKGPLCGNCYSKKLHEYYPGDHVRVNREE